MEGGSMPKQTFIKLKEEKKKKVEEAIRKEFTRVPLERISISNIVSNANIPRGSFYQYFEDKEDAIDYIVKKYVEEEYKKVYELLKKTKGNIFEAFLEFYDYKANELIQENNYNLNKHVIYELRKININILNYRKEADRELMDKIDKKSLNIKDDEELRYIIRILSILNRALVIEVASKKKTIEEGKKAAKRMIKILKDGMERSEENV